MGNTRLFVEFLSQCAQKRSVCGPVVLRTWSCSETILVCLDIRDLLGFVLLGMVFGWACHARIAQQHYPISMLIYSQHTSVLSKAVYCSDLVFLPA